MARKDKFAQLHKEGGGALGSFQNLAATVAAIDQQEQEQEAETKQVLNSKEKVLPKEQPAQVNIEEPRFMRLPNPKIPLDEYNRVSSYCNSFPNMTRQDFVELAILEKLYKDAGLPKKDFDKRYKEIRERPARGHRRGTMK